MTDVIRLSDYRTGAALRPASVSVSLARAERAREYARREVRRRGGGYVVSQDAIAIYCRTCKGAHKMRGGQASTTASRT